MQTSSVRLLALWVCLLVAIGSCAADSRSLEGGRAGGDSSTPRGEPQGKAAMPAALRMAVLRTQQKAAGYDFARDAGGTLRTRAGGFGATAAVEATARGVRLSRSDDGGFALSVETTSVGREGSLASRGVKDQHAEGQELVLDREDGVEERYLAGPLGLEHSYLVGRRPEGTGLLAIEVAFAGLTPELAEGATDKVLLRDEAGLVRAGYRDLVAVDANGQDLPARMDVREAGVALVIDDVGAAYPLRVDPVVWTQQAMLTASDGAAGDAFGHSVAVSGTTAIVGAPSHTVGANMQQGAAYVFVQSGMTWTQQAMLTASDGAVGDAFGHSVAVSGTTAIVGAPSHTVGANMQQGAAYVFVQSGMTWIQQATLTASDGAAGDAFGHSVAVSGTTAIVGAPTHTVGANMQQGAAYVFVQSGMTWTQQAMLTASDGAAGDAFGHSVAVSGSTAIVGASNHTVGANMQQGAAYVFAQSGMTWIQQATLTASDGAANDHFGISVAVSGTTTVVGASNHTVGANMQQGAAYVFVQSGMTWTQQATLTASDGATGHHFGISAAVNGTTAVVGAPDSLYNEIYLGAAYVFVQSGMTWTQQATLPSDGNGDISIGTSVAVSGTTAVVGSSLIPGKPMINTMTQVFEFCLISGGAYGAGTLNPTNPCQVCEPTKSTNAWSDQTAGTTCGTALYCSGGTCASGCLIGGTFYPAGTVNSMNVCQVCTPASSSTAWSDETSGTSCGTGQVCNGATCFSGCFIGGTFYPAGTVNPANACQVCTTATSTIAWSNQLTGTGCEPGKVCSSGMCSSACFIGGILYPSSKVNPANACQVCIPATSTIAWSNEPVGTSCDDGNSCTQTDTCQSSVCIGSIPVVCTASDQCHIAGTCEPSTGKCSSPAAPDGTVCSLGACQAGECTASPDGGTGTGGQAGSSSSGTGTEASSSSSGFSSGSDGSGGGAEGILPSGSGCNCQLHDESPARAAWPLGVLPLLLLRRRRSKTGARLTT